MRVQNTKAHNNQYVRIIRCFFSFCQDEEDLYVLCESVSFKTRRYFSPYLICDPKLRFIRISHTLTINEC